MKSTNQTGSTLLGLIIIMPFLILIVAIYMDLTVASFRTARGDQMRTHAQLATDGGLDVAMEQISADDNWAGTAGEVQLHNDGKIRTTYEVTVTNVDEDTKSLLATGRTYNPIGSATPSATVSINVDLRPVTSGEYSVVSGVGGLIMSNSARILGGDVFINGTIQLSNSAQIGLSTNPVNLSVAHYSCPNPVTSAYPRHCNSGENGQPISISNTARIYGTVRANNQTNSSGISSPGLLTPACLVAGAAPSGTNCVTAASLPAHNRQAQKDAVNPANDMTGATASCSSGTRTWYANTKITGNVSVSNSCKVTVEGNVWITGTLSTSNSSEVIVSNTLGTTRPVIMVDGTSANFSNSSILRSNTSNTGFMIINYRSDASCSPDCSDVTGADLNNSRGDERISLSNSASGPHTIFYARWTKVRVNNSGQIGALVGQTVELSNSSTITFGTSIGTGTRFWVIDSYRRSF